MKDNTQNKVRNWIIIAVIAVVYIAVAVMVAVERNEPNFQLCPLCGEEGAAWDLVEKLQKEKESGRD
jgi:hypothetical protein